MMDRMRILFLNYDIDIKTKFKDVVGMFGGHSKTSGLFKERFSWESSDFELYFYNYDDIRIIDGDIFANEIKIRDFDYVFFGFVSRNTTLAKMVMEVLDDAKVPYFRYGNLSHLDNKAYELGIFKKHGYPYIPTLMTSWMRDSDYEYVRENFGYPCVYKPYNSNRGENVHKVKTEKKLKSFFVLPGRNALIQKYIPNNGDYRVIVFKGKVILVAKRVTTSSDFRNNVSQGGTIIKEDLPKEIRQQCESLSKHISCDMVGVDVIIDNITGEHYFMEANSAPHYFSFCTSCDVDIPGMIVREIIDTLS